MKRQREAKASVVPYLSPEAKASVVLYLSPGEFVEIALVQRQQHTADTILLTFGVMLNTVPLAPWHIRQILTRTLTPDPNP